LWISSVREVGACAVLWAAGAPFSCCSSCSAASLPAWAALRRYFSYISWLAGTPLPVRQNCASAYSASALSGSISSALQRVLKSISSYLNIFLHPFYSGGTASNQRSVISRSCQDYRESARREFTFRRTQNQKNFYSHYTSPTAFCNRPIYPAV